MRCSFLALALWQMLLLSLLAGAGWSAWEGHWARGTFVLAVFLVLDRITDNRGVT